MKAFLVTAGSVFGLLVVVHVARMSVEPRMAKDPWFWAITIVAGGLSLWAWRLVCRLRRSGAASVRSIGALSGAGNSGMIANEHTPRAIRPDADADPRTPLDRSDNNPAILDEQPVAEQVQPVFPQRNPHRHRQIARTATEIVVGKGVDSTSSTEDLARASTTHQVDAVQRSERANQHGCG